MSKYIGTQEVTSEDKKDGRIVYVLANGAAGTATQRQFSAMCTEEPLKTNDGQPCDDQLVIAIRRFTPDVEAILETIKECDVNYNDAQFILQRAILSLTEGMEAILCNVVGGAFNTSMVKMNQVNDIPLRDLNDKVKS